MLESVEINRVREGWGGLAQQGRRGGPVRGRSTE